MILKRDLNWLTNVMVTFLQMNLILVQLMMNLCTSLINNSKKLFSLAPKMMAKKTCIEK
jgi:hypothetical protein